MKVLSNVLPIVLLITWSACRERITEEEGKGSQVQEARAYLISDLGDTIPTRVRLPVTSRIFQADSISRPFLKEASSPVKKPIDNNVSATFKLETIPIDFGKVKVLTPGANGLVAARKISLKRTVLPALTQVVKAVGDLRAKDIATHNIYYLDVAQGLRTSFIKAIGKDTGGHIWFSSAGQGVCRYDGKFISCLTASEGLISNIIHGILEDQDLNLWFGGNGGVSKYDGRSFINYELPTRQGAVLGIFEDSQGNIWWGTTADGVIRYDPLLDEFTQFQDKGLFQSGIFAIAEDTKGNLWFGGSEGAYVYNGKHFIHFTREDGLVYEAVTGIVEDTLGRIWLTTHEGFSIYDGVNFQNQVSSPSGKKPTYHSAFRDSEGQIWLATKRQGIFRFDGRNFYQYGEKEGLRYNEVLQIIEDDRGQIWLATFGGGINKLDVNGFRYFSTSEGLLNNYVDGLVADQEQNLWIANDRLIKYDGSAFSYYGTAQGLPDSRVYCVTKDRDNNIWAGMDDGVVKFDGKHFIYYRFKSNSTLQILPAKNGDVWFTTSPGLIRLSGSSYTRFGVQEGLLSDQVNTLAEDHEGNIWISTGSALTKFDGETVTHFSVENSTGGQPIICLYADRESNLWLGTSEGLYRFQAEEPLVAGQNTIPPGEPVSGIQEDNRGNLWVSTERNLFLLLRQGSDQASGFKCRAFYGHAELKIEGFTPAICIDQSNQLWLGSTKGMTVLPLDDFYERQEPYVPKVYLNRIQLNEQDIELFDHSGPEIEPLSEGQKKLAAASSSFFNYPTNLIVPHDINHFTFTYAGVDWRSTAQIRYQYQLRGLDKNWSQVTTENKVDYRNLPPGTYTFQVKAQSETDTWSEPVTYAFTIRPPWWLSWWAYMAYVALFGGLLLLIFNFLQRRWQLQSQLRYEQTEAQRLKELDSFKSRLYTNLTHEFRTPLTVILGMADQLREGSDKNLKEATQLIERNGKNLLRLINQLLDLSKLENQAFRLQLEQGDLVQYVRYLTESFQTYSNSHQLSLQCYSDIEHQIMDYDPEQIKQIMTNLISNALKFTPPGGSIKISLGKEKQDFRIEVADTGIGIAEKDLPHIFNRFYQVDDSSTRKGEGTGIGLAHTRELVQLMGGSIMVKSQEQQGTTFIVRLPITNNSPFPSHPEKNIIPEPIGIAQVAPEFPVLPERADIPSVLPQLLIIEDNYDVVVYLQTCLAGRYQIAVANNGRAGIEMAIQHTPDLIISDVMMPEKDGYELCEALKNDERTSHIPIILLTAKADTSSRIMGLSRGADAYLSKPFDKEELLVRLQMLVEKQQKLATYFQRKWQESTVGSIPAETSLAEDELIENTFLQKLTGILDANYEDDQFGLSELCEALNMSRSQLFRKLKALIGQSPSEFIRSFRLKKAKYLLEYTELNVNEVTWATGFTNPTHFSRVFKEEFGFPPGRFNK